MAEPVSGNLKLINIIAGDRLRPGDFVSARVQARLPDGRYKLLWNGRTLTARSHVSLTPGRFIRARVEGRSGNLTLRLLNTDSSKSSPHSLPVSSRTLLSAALLRAGLPLPGEGETARRAALLSRTKGRKIRIARLYADLLSKGTDPTADFLESVDSIFSDSRDKGDQGRGQRKNGNWPGPPDGGDLSEELADDGDDADPVINLLNKVPDDRENWMYRRLFRNLDDQEIQLTWKIRGGLNPALALTVYDGNRTLEFLMEGLEQTRMSVFSGSNVEIDAKQWDSFRKSLALKNIRVDDTILSIDESDGFTPGNGKTVQDLEGRE